MSEGAQAKLLARTKELENQIAFASIILKSIPFIVLAIDLRGRIFYFNQYMKDITGRRHVQSLVDKDWISIFVPPEERENITATMSKTKRSFTCSILSNEGIKVPFEWETQDYIDHEGNKIGLILIGRNLTAVKEAEAQKKELQIQLRQAQKMEILGTFAGKIAHEFNNILMTIIGQAELALPQAKGELRKRLEGIKSAANQAAKLTRQILTFSRKTDTQHGKIKFSPLIEQALELFDSIIPNSILLQTNLMPEGDEISADPGQLHQVLTNILTNAIHAMEEKGGTLSINLDEIEISGCRSNLEPGKYIRLLISDTGSGIPDEIKERVFEPFFTTKPSGKGTGMGLAIVHGIILGHGGSISVESKIDEGTAFQILLPRFEVNGK